MPLTEQLRSSLDSRHAEFSGPSRQGHLPARGVAKRVVIIGGQDNHVRGAMIAFSADTGSAARPHAQA